MYADKGCRLFKGLLVKWIIKARCSGTTAWGCGCWTLAHIHLAGSWTSNRNRNATQASTSLNGMASLTKAVSQRRAVLR